jgi:hypothetical protein
VLTSQGASAWTWATPASAATNLTFSGASSPFTLNSSSGTDVTFTAGSGIGLSASSGNITLTATDASATNEAQTLSSSGSAISLSAVSGSGGGTVTLNAGTDISLTTGTNSITINSKIAGFGQLSNDLISNATLSVLGITTVDFDESLVSSDNMTVSTADDRITFTSPTTRVVRVTYSGSYIPDTTAGVIFSVYKNGSTVGHLGELLVENDYTQNTNFNKSFFISASQNDYFNLVFKRNTGTNTNMDIYDVVFNIEIIH